jgi:uncharacterized membrane protein
MEQPRSRWSDERVEQVVGNLLRIGVLAAAAVVLIGGILYLIENGHKYSDYRKFKGEPASLRSPAAIIQDALAGDSRGVIQLGLLLLIATPVARVIFSAYAFTRQRDMTYVVITLIVLAVLLFSLFSGPL